MADQANPLAAHVPNLAATPQAVTIQYVPGQVRMFQLSEEKVESLAGCGDNLGIYLTFLGISVGALISWASIWRFSPPSDPSGHAVVLALTVSSAFATVFLSILGGTAFFRRRRQINALLGRPSWIVFLSRWFSFRSS